LTKLLFFWGRRLWVNQEGHDHWGEVLGGPFGNRSPVNVADDAATYFLCAFVHGCGRGFHTGA
jgi:hypothetical protein